MFLKRYSDILTIFDIRRETQLDKKILSALLKGHDMSLHHQLYLAMVWNRVDLAEEKIFVHGHGKRKNREIKNCFNHFLFIQTRSR